jgi:hypothetical protein
MKAPFFGAFARFDCRSPPRLDWFLAQPILDTGHRARDEPPQRSVIVPAGKIIVDRAARRQVRGDIAPRAPGADDIHPPINDFPHVHCSLVAAQFGRWDQRRNQCPFLIRQIMAIAQASAVVLGRGLWRPHQAPRNRCRAWTHTRFEPVNPPISTRLQDSSCSRTDTNTRRPVFTATVILGELFVYRNDRASRLALARKRLIAARHE